MTVELDRAALRHTLGLLETLTGLTNEDGLPNLLESTGWDGPALGITDPSMFAGAVGGLETGLEKLSAVLDQDKIGVSDIAEALAPLGLAVADVVTFISSLPTPATVPADAFGKFGEDLVGFLIEHHVSSRFSRVAIALTLLGILKTSDAAEITTTDGRVLRRATRRRAIDLGAVSRALRDPIAYLRERFLLDPQGGRRTASAIADLIGPELADGLVRAGVTASYGAAAVGPGVTLTQSELDAVDRFLAADFSFPTGVPGVRPGLRTLAVLTDDTAPATGLGFVLQASGNLTVAIHRPSATITAHLQVNPQAILLTSSGVSFASGGPGAVLFEADLGFATVVGPNPAIRFGPADGTRFEVGELQVAVSFDLDAAGIDVGTVIDVKRILVAIQGGDGDGFLDKILPRDPIELRADVGLDASLRKGVRFRGAATLSHRIPIGLSLGPLKVQSLDITLRLSAEGVALEITGAFDVTLGPLQMAIEGLGLTAGLRPATPASPGASPAGNVGPFDLKLGFKPPRGIGAVIDGSIVKGGGFISNDPEKGEYAGVLELSLEDVVQLKAIGILNTKMPDGRPGFSLLFIITAQFQPIQLGLGFTLSGVGGLIGVNRTMLVDVLRAGIKNRTLDSMLFPTDPVRNAPKIISDLGSIYPPAEGRFVFGPMVELGWGTPTLLTARLGLFIELPAPIRLAILAQIKATLPNPKAPLVKINLDAIGIIEFEKQSLSIDATIYDSVIVAFALSGDMALRLCWGAVPNFIVSMGGFNPRFNPPAGVPRLNRLMLSLGAGENPRISLDTYIAVTSNSVQFGAHLELRAEGGGFVLHGFFGFDALFIFVPFSFIVEMEAGIELLRGGSALMSIHVALSLAGPVPWHASGTATFHILFLNISVAFDTTWGEGAQPEVPLLDARDPLLAALADARNWSAALPAETELGVSLADAKPSPDTVLVHPVGRLTVRQKIVPLESTITKFGNAAPAGANHFSISKASVGTTPVSHDRVEDYFAPAQFKVMSDADAITSSSYKLMDAGVTIGASALESGPRSNVEVLYSTQLVDNPRLPSTPVVAPYRPSAAAYLALIHAGPGERSLVLNTGRMKYATPGRGSVIDVSEPDFVIVSTDDLSVRDDLYDGAGGREMRVRDQLERHLAAHPDDRLNLHVMPVHEVAA